MTIMFLGWVMYSKREELIKPCTEMQLIEHGLNLKLEISQTLSTDYHRQGTCPFSKYNNHKMVSVESTPDFVIDESIALKYLVSKHLFSIGIKGLVHVIWLPLYKAVDKKGGWAYSTENIIEEQAGELIGFVYTNKDKVRKSFGVKYVSASIKRDVIEELKVSVAHYTAWSNYDVYGVTITDAQGIAIPFGLGIMTYQNIYNFDNAVDEAAKLMIYHTSRIIRDSKHSIEMVVRFDKHELSNSDWREDTPLSVYLNSSLENMFGTQLALVESNKITIKGETKKEVMEAVIFKVDISRLPPSLKLSDDEYEALIPVRRNKWRESDDLPDWQALKIHELLASMINKVDGFELLQIGKHTKKKTYLNIPWRRPIASRSFK